MKVKVSTWIARGVTEKDLVEWTDQGLIKQDYDNNMIWTQKSPSKWPKAAQERYYTTAGKEARAYGDALKANNAYTRQRRGDLIARYGKGVREVSHRCSNGKSVVVFVTTHGEAYDYHINLEGNRHFCDLYQKGFADMEEAVEVPQDVLDFNTFMDTYGGESAIIYGARRDEQDEQEEEQIKVLTEAEIKALDGTPGPARLSNYFPFGKKN